MIRQSQTTEPHRVTALLQAWGAGDERALGELMSLVERELHRVAAREMRAERAGHTLQPTALVNEAFLRLVEIRHIRWQGRAHFLAMFARLMRRVLVDAARSKRRHKRGAGVQLVPFESVDVPSGDGGHDVIAMHEALEGLSAIDARKGQVVELRFFGGLGVEETAEVLHVSPDTVMRDWKLAKAWLRRELRGQRRDG